MTEPNVVEFTAEEIIRTCITDAINRFINKGLIPAELLDQTKWKEWYDSPDFYAIRNDIADSIAVRWGEALKKKAERY